MRACPIYVLDYHKIIKKDTVINYVSFAVSKKSSANGPCIAEMPQLSKLKERYKDKVNFISITENDAAEDHLSDFLKNKDFNFQVLDRGQDYKNELKLMALPRNLFVDKTGILRYIQGNYPVSASAISMAIDDKDNYFTKIIDELIKDAK